MSKRTSLALPLVALLLAGACERSRQTLTPIGTPCVCRGIADALDAQETCPLHHVATIEKVVRIRYGDLAEVYPDTEARKQFFPMSILWLEGGCTITPDSPHEAHVRSCPQCEIAERAWQAGFSTGLKWGFDARK